MSAAGVRTLIVWCPDWPVIAAEIVDGVSASGPVVVLHANLSLDPARKRHPSAHISRMQIVGCRSRRYLEQVLHLGQRLLEELHRLVVFQVPDVLAQDRVSVLRQTKRILQLAAKREYFLDLHTQINGLRHISA